MPVAKNLPYLCLSLFVTITFLTSCTGNVDTAPGISPSPAASSPPDVSAGFGLDKSPMDMVYFPSDYPIKKMSGNIDGPPIARLIYSRPRKAGRPIFGDVVEYGSPWRLGANEATEIEFFRDVFILNQKVLKGRYVMYCTPHPETWKITFNRDLHTWGLKIHPSLDAYTFEVPTVTSPTPVEVFTMDFENQAQGFALWIAWDSTRVALPINSRG